jgi:hypothetical protein
LLLCFPFVFVLGSLVFILVLVMELSLLVSLSSTFCNFMGKQLNGAIWRILLHVLSTNQNNYIIGMIWKTLITTLGNTRMGVVVGFTMRKAGDHHLETKGRLDL